MTLLRPWGKWGWGIRIGIWVDLRRKREDFTKTFMWFFSDIVKKHYLNMILSWNYHRFNSIREGGPALHSFPETLRDSCCLDEILLYEKMFFRSSNFSVFHCQSLVSCGWWTVLFTCVIWRDWCVAKTQSAVITLWSVD